MGFVVEDGTGLATANSYVAVADCDSYHSDRGNTGWAGTDAAKQAALIEATSYCDGRYRNRWPSIPLLSTQALEWPREEAYDARGAVISGIPQRLKDAVCEAALLALEGEDLAPSLERGGLVASETVGPISTSYAEAAPGRSSYTVVEDLLRGLLAAGGVKVVRV